MDLAVAAVDPMVPEPYRITRVIRELSDTFTIDLVPAKGRGRFRFAPGQFNMLYVFGVGEVPISISGDTENTGRVRHTIRAVGTVTDALRRLKKGAIVGLRGPFGSAWPMAEAEGSDVIIVGGGVGLAPLRPAIYHVLNNRERYGKVCLFYGARTPDDILFRAELEKWRSRFDMFVDVTVDRATGHWAGPVGVVTQLIRRGGFDAFHAQALVCGPEIMMRFAVATLNNLGVSDDRIYVSLERNMKCAIGFCGHCQFGGAFVCKDGPVFRFDEIVDLFGVREF